MAFIGGFSFVWEVSQRSLLTLGCNRLYLEIKGNEVCIQKVCVHATSLSCVRLFATLWTVARQAPLSVGFSRQEYWSGLPCPPSEDLPDTGIEPSSLRSPALAGGFFTTSTSWKAHRRGQTVFIEVKVRLEKNLRGHRVDITWGLVRNAGAIRLHRGPTQAVSAFNQDPLIKCSSTSLTYRQLPEYLSLCKRAIP